MLKKVGVAAVGDDIRAVLGEGARDVLEQACAVPGLDGDLDAEAGRRGSRLPFDGGEALGIAP